MDARHGHAGGHRQRPDGAHLPRDAPGTLARRLRQRPVVAADVEAVRAHLANRQRT